MTQEQILAVLQGPDGSEVGPQLNLPLDITPANLQQLLNQFLNETDNYAFFVNDTEIKQSLRADIIDKQKISSEQSLRINFIPQASFKVSPVTRCSSSLTGHTESVICVQFSPDGLRAASASGDTTVRIWDLNTETPQHTLTGHKNWVLCLAWSPDGKYVASGSMDNTVIVWNAKTGKQVGAPLRGHSKYVTSIAWEPYHLNPECQRLATSSKDGTARVWNAINGRCEFIVSSHTDAVSCVKWSGEGMLYTASRDKTIKVWDAKNGVLIRTLVGHAHWINCMALSTDYVLRQGPYSDGDCKLMTAEECKERYEQVKQKAKGERLVTGSDDFTMFLWSPSTDKKPLARMTGHQQLVNHVAFTPDGRLIASGSFDKSIKLWNGFNGTFITSLRGHVSPVYQVCFSSDSRYLLSGSKDSTLKLWSLDTRTLKADLPGHADEVFTVDWSPGKEGRVISGGRDRVIKFWRR
ncbi:hypothetical protein MP228_009042 [Amoeboaphelidium protococcarum]|nr:hypothetical protein MP228_009042 [Amoeboaphelidium protococcarum]